MLIRPTLNKSKGGATILKVGVNALEGGGVNAVKILNFEKVGGA